MVCAGDKHPCSAMVGIRYLKFPFCYDEFLLGVGIYPVLVEEPTANLAARSLSGILEELRDPPAYPSVILLATLDRLGGPITARDMECVWPGMVSRSRNLALACAPKTATNLRRATVT